MATCSAFFLPLYPRVDRLPTRLLRALRSDNSTPLSRRTMTSLLRELHKPSTFLGLVAVILNAAAVIAAYKVNPVPVTVCGALGILATM